MVGYRNRFRKRNRRPKEKVPKATKKYVKRAFDRQIEDKARNSFTIPGAAVGAAVPTYQLLNGMPLGTQIDQRIGERIRMKHIWIDLLLSIDPNTLPLVVQSRQCRVMLIYDKQPNSAVPTTGQLFWNSTGGQMFFSPLNPAGEERFTILFDKHYRLGVEGGATDVAVEFPIKINRKLRDLKTVYNAATTGTVTDINTGSLYLVLTCDLDVIYEYQALLRFEDA